MQRRSEHDNAGLPPELQRSSPRQVRLTASGRLFAILAVALVGAALWSGLALYRHARMAALSAPPALVLGAFALAYLVRRQTVLLEYGRPALAVVTKVEKKKGEEGTFWNVHYEWKLLSGGKGQGRYIHGKKHPPAIGSALTIVYDRDNPRRSSRYPMGLVGLR